MMVEFCQEKESKTAFEFNTFVFFFLKKTKKRAYVKRTKIPDEKSFGQNFFSNTQKQ